MIIFRIIFSILLLPLLLLAYVLKLFFSLVVLIGAKIIMIIGCLALLGGIFVIYVEEGYGSGENTVAGIGMIIGGIITAISPYIVTFIIAALNAFIEFVKGFLFG